MSKFEISEIYIYDINLQWVLGLVTKYKYILINLYLHIWLILKTWRNFLVDDLEENYKIEKIKRFKKSLLLLLLLPFIILFFNSFLKFISK